LETPKEEAPKVEASAANVKKDETVKKKESVKEEASIVEEKPESPSEKK
jgi:hypothetical protein